MSLKSSVTEVLRGFKSLLVGLRITGREATKPIITVQYPHETLPMPERFRGHLELVVDPATGQTTCTACGLCVRACPSDCLDVEGLKKEGEKRKSVSKYEQDFTKCSLCGCCVDACPGGSIQYSKDYNVVSTDRSVFAKMDIFQRAEAKKQKWAETHPQPAPPPPAVPASSATPAEPSPSAAPVTPAPTASAAPAAAPAPEAKQP